MSKKIEDRIKELEAEVQKEQQMLAQLNNEINRITSSIISKTGAITELKKLNE